MKSKMLKFLCVLIAVVGSCCLWPVNGASPQPQSGSAAVATVVQDGLAIWPKKGASYAFDIWQKGGLLEDDRKPQIQVNYFRRLDRVLGNYRSYEVIDTKQISPNSQVLYLSMNFERVAMYARFVLYNGEKGWVVQNMDFSPKPEAIMPWLAFNEGNYSE